MRRKSESVRSCTLHDHPDSLQDEQEVVLPYLGVEIRLGSQSCPNLGNLSNLCSVYP